ncbi:MAG TPA: FHIPEP family type III secretion protein [Aggregatilineales bacterium]|nr:FHIPEP family type III secretion protein [Anaerolineales bacterium]HRE47382.1 FHIPEP family type III secretion protein [Aggregatilineales bacterium]
MPMAADSQQTGQTQIAVTIGLSAGSPLAAALVQPPASKFSRETTFTTETVLLHPAERPFRLTVAGEPRLTALEHLEAVRASLSGNHPRHSATRGDLAAWLDATAEANPALAYRFVEALCAATLTPPLTSTAPITVCVAADYLRELTREDSEANRANFPFLRDGMMGELGIALPPFAFSASHTLPARTFAFEINGVQTTPRQGLASGEIFVNGDLGWLMPYFNAGSGQPCANPTNFTAGAVGVVSEANRLALNELGCTLWTPFGFLILSAAQMIRDQAAAFVTPETTDSLLTSAATFNSETVRVARETFSPEQVAEVCRALLREGLPLRDVRGILHGMLTAPNRDDLDGLIAGARRSQWLRFAAFCGQGVYDLAEDAQAVFRAALRREDVLRLVDQFEALGGTVIVRVPPALRRAVVAHLRPALPRLTVIAEDELPPKAAITSRGVVGLA